MATPFYWVENDYNEDEYKAELREIEEIEAQLKEELRQAKEAYRQGDCTDEVIQVLETAITSYV